MPDIQEIRYECYATGFNSFNFIRYNSKGYIFRHKSYTIIRPQTCKMLGEETLKFISSVAYGLRYTVCPRNSYRIFEGECYGPKQ
jgi:hypothetical protein